MPTYTPSSSPVFTHFFAPLAAAYPQSENRYSCKELTDLDYLEMGVTRVLSESKTGRDFIQRHADHGRKEVSPDLFFKALKSPRRSANAASINRSLARVMAGKCNDPFSGIRELDKFEVFAGDGHYHGAAVHDSKMESSSGGMKKYATGHFFTTNLRNHHMEHIATAAQGDGRKCEHDMRAIKRSAIDTLRGGAPKGTKVLMAWDPACIDFAFWDGVKHSSGLYFISRQKDNMKLEVAEWLDIEHQDPRNNGVVADQIVIPASGKGKFRRITYVEAVEGIRYVYITTEMTLPPWVIVMIYRHRWDIEKIFDEFKNKLEERKSWGSGSGSKTTHAQFMCIAHNLMILCETEILKDAKIENWKESERRESRSEHEKSRGAHYVSRAIQRATVRSVKFIRWLRNHIYREVSWESSLERLRAIYANY